MNPDKRRGMKQMYEFGAFHLDSSERIFTFNGQRIPLAPKAFDTLLILVQHSGRVLSKEELINRLWPDSFVEENNLPQHISALRRVLGNPQVLKSAGSGASIVGQDQDGQEYIETVPKVGYRFVCQVREITEEDAIETGEAELVASKRTRTRVVRREEREEEETEEEGAPEGFRCSTQPRNLWEIPRGGALLPIAKQHRFGLGLVSSFVMLLVAVCSYEIYGFFSRMRPTPFQNFTVRKVTETGKATLAAISPDGKYILNVVVDDDGQQSLWLRNVPTGSNAQIVPSASVSYTGLRFSPDGNYLYFVRSEIGGHSPNYLYRTPVLGGTLEKLISDVDSNVSFAPDGKQFVYMRVNSPKVGRYRVIIHSLETNEEKELASGPLTEWFMGPAWSPDGRTIVCVVAQPDNAYSGLVAIDVQSGKQKLFATSNDRFFEVPVWLPNGKGLMVLGNVPYFTQTQIFFVSFPEGKRLQVTRDTDDYADISLTTDGHTLATVVKQTHLNLFVLPDAANGSEAQRLTTDAPSNEISWTRDGQLIASASAGGFTMLNPSSGTRAAFLAQPLAPNYAGSCSDGHIVFSAPPRGDNSRIHVWRADADGGNPHELTNGKFEWLPACTPDAKTVLYADADGRLAKIPLQGGDSQSMGGLGLLSRISFSPDGKYAALVSFREGEPKEKLVLVPLDSGQSPRFLDFERPRSVFIVGFGDAPAPHITEDGKGFVYPVRNGEVDNLWLQYFDGPPGRQITNFTSELIRDFNWSYDGKQLAVIRGHQDSDVAVFRDAGFP